MGSIFQPPSKVRLLYFLGGGTNLGAGYILGIRYWISICFKPAYQPVDEDSAELMRLASPSQTLEMLFFSLFGLVEPDSMWKIWNFFEVFFLILTQAPAPFGARFCKNCAQVLVRHLYDGHIDCECEFYLLFLNYPIFFN